MTIGVKVVVAEDYDKYVSDFPNTLVIRQANEKALVNQQSFFKTVSKTSIMALVPACTPTVVSQVPDILCKALAACYQSCLMEAVKTDSETILIHPLGVPMKYNPHLDERGEKVYDIRYNLFWTHPKSSMAARHAVLNLAGIEANRDVTIIFVVPSEAYDDWDTALNF